MDVVMAAGVVEDAKGLALDVKNLLIVGGLGILYAALVVIVGLTKRSILATIVAAVGGAVMLGIVSAQTALSSKTKEEIEKDHSAPAAVVRVVAPPGPGEGELDIVHVRKAGSGGAA